MPRVVITPFILAVSFAPAASLQSLEEMLQKFEDHLARLPSWNQEINTHTLVTGDVANPDYCRVYDYSFKFRRRGHDFDVEYLMEKRKEIGGPIVLSGYGTRSVAIKDHIFSESAYGRGFDPPIVAQDRLVFPETAHPSLYLDGGEMLQGFLGRDGIRFVDLVRKGPVGDIAVSHDVVRDTECTRLTVRIEGRGRYSLWLDGDGGLVQAIVEKSGDDFYFDKKVSETYEHKDTPGVTWGAPNFPSEIYTNVKIELKNVAFEDIDGYRIPTSYETEITQTYPNGQSTTFTSNHRCTKTELSPDFKAIKTFEWAFPQGTPVQQMGLQSSGRFEFHEGEMRPEIDTRLRSHVPGKGLE